MTEGVGGGRARRHPRQDENRLARRPEVRFASVPYIFGMCRGLAQDLGVTGRPVKLLSAHGATSQTGFPRCRAIGAVFIAHGYQRTPGAGRGRLPRPGQGTLYGYAQGKAAVRGSDCAAATRKPFRWHPDCLPVARSRCGRDRGLWCQPDWLARSPTCSSRTPCESDFAAGCDDWRRASRTRRYIVTDLCSRLAGRIALKLVDRCTYRLPTSPRFGSAPAERPSRCGPERHLVHRERAGLLILPGPAPMVARTVELCALWAKCILLRRHRALVDRAT